MTTPPVAPLPVHGTVPLRARWEQWMQELVENPQDVSALTSVSYTHLTLPTKLL